MVTNACRVREVFVAGVHSARGSSKRSGEWCNPIMQSTLHTGEMDPDRTE